MRRLLPLVALALAACTASRPTATDNPRLTALYEQDQSDRRTVDDAHWVEVDRRDAERCQAVAQMLTDGTVVTAADHYHAAMVFQHGDDSTAFRRAHELAVTAEQMGSAPARWLAAASLDRYLLDTGRPQHYGTQFAERPGGWFLSPIDSLAVTDAERHRAGTRTLAEIRAFLAEKNGTPTGSLTPPPARPEPPSVELIGGMDGLVSQIAYPDEARAAGISGTVKVQLAVATDGTVGEAFVVSGLGHGLDEEVLRVVRQARFVNRAGEPWEMRLLVPVAP